MDQSAPEVGLEKTMNLNAPSRTTFIVSLVLAIVAWISFIASVPYLGEIILQFS